MSSCSFLVSSYSENSLLSTPWIDMMKRMMIVWLSSTYWAPIILKVGSNLPMDARILASVFSPYWPKILSLGSRGTNKLSGICSKEMKSSPDLISGIAGLEEIVLVVVAVVEVVVETGLVGLIWMLLFGLSSTMGTLGVSILRKEESTGLMKSFVVVVGVGIVIVGWLEWLIWIYFGLNPSGRMTCLVEVVEEVVEDVVEDAEEEGILLTGSETILIGSEMI